MTNKYWWLYFLVVAAAVFFFGSVLYTDIAYGAGLVLVPALIAGVILWRARSDTGVTAGFVVLVGILVYFGYDHYGDVREDSYRAMVEGCVSSISETQPQLSNHAVVTDSVEGDHTGSARIGKVMAETAIRRFHFVVSVRPHHSVEDLTARQGPVIPVFVQHRLRLVE